MISGYDLQINLIFDSCYKLFHNNNDNNNNK